MKQNTKKFLENLIKRLPCLEICRSAIEQAFSILKECYSTGGKVLACGNGGSAADSEHIVGELMKGFLLKRKIRKEDTDRLIKLYTKEGRILAETLQGALPAISLVSHVSLNLAFINDVSPEMIFAQQVYGYGRQGDILIGISTSGCAKNVVNALKIAKAFELKTIGLTGESGGVMRGLCDVTITVPSSDTYIVQEYHQSVYHTLCAMIEYEFFGT